MKKVFILGLFMALLVNSVEGQTRWRDVWVDSIHTSMFSGDTLLWKVDRSSNAKPGFCEYWSIEVECLDIARTADSMIINPVTGNFYPLRRTKNSFQSNVYPYMVEGSDSSVVEGGVYGLTLWDFCTVGAGKNIGMYIDKNGSDPDGWIRWYWIGY